MISPSTGLSGQSSTTASSSSASTHPGYVNDFVRSTHWLAPISTWWGHWTSSGESDEDLYYKDWHNRRY